MYVYLCWISSHVCSTHFHFNEPPINKIEFMCVRASATLLPNQLRRWDMWDIRNERPRDTGSYFEVLFRSLQRLPKRPHNIFLLLGVISFSYFRLCAYISKIIQNKCSDINFMMRFSSLCPKISTLRVNYELTNFLQALTQLCLPYICLPLATYIKVWGRQTNDADDKGVGKLGRV